MFIFVLSLKATIAVFDWLNIFRETQKICSENLLEAQKNQVPVIKSLFDLNPQVKKLAAQKALWKAKWAAAVASHNHSAAAYCQHQYFVTQAAQARLGAFQKKILQTSQLQMKSGMLRTEMLLQNYFLQHVSAEETFLPRLILIRRNPYLMAVRAIPWADGPPIFERDQPFTDKQASQVFWKYNVEINSREVLGWHSLHFTKQDSCAASLDLNLRETLHAGKSS